MVLTNKHINISYIMIVRTDIMLLSIVADH